MVFLNSASSAAALVYTSRKFFREKIQYLMNTLYIRTIYIYIARFYGSIKSIDELPPDNVVPINVSEVEELATHLVPVHGVLTQPLIYSDIQQLT